MEPYSKGELPYNFEDRLVELDLPSKAIRFVTPSLEDLVVMKLYAWRDLDIIDLSSKETLEQLDWDRLDELVYGEDEAKTSALSTHRYDEMVHIYTHYKEKYRHERDV